MTRRRGFGKRGDNLPEDGLTRGARRRAAIKRGALPTTSKKKKRRAK
jgi:hypothetical protein